MYLQLLDRGITTECETVQMHWCQYYFSLTCILRKYLVLYVCNNVSYLYLREIAYIYVYVYVCHTQHICIRVHSYSLLIYVLMIKK